MQRVAKDLNRVRPNRIDERARAEGSLNRSCEYTPARAFEIISIMADGYSVTTAAAKMGVHRDKIDEWAKQHPEFADAIKRGEAVRVWKLETDLLRARNGPVVRARIFMLKHADPREYGDLDTDPPIEDPLQRLYKEISGNVLRPVEDCDIDPCTQRVTSGTESPEAQVPDGTSGEPPI